jgi:nitroreductase
MNMGIDELLTTTRSARKALDLDAPVEPSSVRQCLRIAMQAANGSNQQSWRWLVVSDAALREAALREKVAALYRDTYCRGWADS